MDTINGKVVNNSIRNLKLKITDAGCLVIKKPSQRNYLLSIHQYPIHIRITNEPRSQKVKTRHIIHK